MRSSLVVVIAALCAVTTARVLTAEETPRTSCPRGERLVDGACKPFDVPEFASLTADGEDFECWRGYVRQGDVCKRLELPEHASLDASGHSFVCHRGYRLDRGTCARIELPEYGRLDASGNDFTCFRGYRRDGDRCLALDVPENAAIDASGNAWSCVRGYEQTGDTCRKIVLPDFAKLDASGNSWTCQPRFERRGNECERVAPEPNGPSDDESPDPRPAETERRTVEVEGFCGSSLVIGTLVRAEASEVFEGTVFDEAGTALEFIGGLAPEGEPPAIAGEADGLPCSFAL